jgi:hypothetical protein
MSTDAGQTECGSSADSHESEWPFVADPRDASVVCAKEASGIGAELRLAAAPGIAVARGWMFTTGYRPDGVFR